MLHKLSKLHFPSVWSWPLRVKAVRSWQPRLVLSSMRRRCVIWTGRLQRPGAASGFGSRRAPRAVCIFWRARASPAHVQFGLWPAISASKCRSRPTSRMLSARSRNGGQAESAQSPQRATVSKFQLPWVPLALDDGSSLHLVFALASPSLDFKSDAENCRILGDSRAACAEDSMKHPRALSLRYTKYWAQVRNIDCMLAHKQRRVTCFGWIYSSNAL